VYGLGEVVTGTLAGGADADTFRVQSAVAEDGAVFLQALGGSVQAVLSAPDGAALATVTAPPAGREEPSGVVPLGAGVTYRVVVSAAGGSGGGGYRVRVGTVGIAPERAPAALTDGGVVEGERLESPTDVDDFTFTGVAGDTYIAFLQAGPGAGSLRVTVPHTSAPSPLAQAESRGGDTELEAQGTGRFTLPASGPYHLTVAAVPGADPYLGDYRLQLRRVGMGPESRPAALVAGDTLTGEGIDFVGDVDEFTLTGTPGDRYNLFFQADPASVRGTLRLEAPGGGGLYVAESDGRRLLLDNSSGRITLPASGNQVVRVLSIYDREVHRGAYRIFTYRVDPRPEHAPASLALNDSVMGERIDLQGDVDEYTLDIPRQSRVVLALSLDDWHLYGVVDAYVAGSEQPFTFASPDRVNAGSYPVTLAAGRYTVRVDGGNGFRTGYRLRAFSADSTPEHAAATLAVGETVDGEDLRPLGDVDVFTFHATAGQELNLFLQGTGGSADGALYALVSGPNGANVRAVFASFASPTLRSRGTRFTVPATGTYRVTVYPKNRGYVFEDQGAYRFSVVPATRAPEHVPATVALGSTVTGESLDYPSDVDEFTVHGTPGSTMEIALQVATDNPFVSLVAEDPATGQLIGRYSAAPWVPRLDSFTVPAGGTVRLMVLEGYDWDDYCPCDFVDFHEIRPYTFTVK